MMPYAISGPDVMNTKKWPISRLVHRSELYNMQTGVRLRDRWLTAVGTGFNMFQEQAASVEYQMWVVELTDSRASTSLQRQLKLALAVALATEHLLGQSAKQHATLCTEAPKQTKKYASSLLDEKSLQRRNCLQKLHTDFLR